MIPLIIGFISAVSFGISNVYWEKAAKDVDFPYLVFFRGVVATSFLGLLLFFCKIFSFDYLGLFNSEGSVEEYLSALLICLVCSFGLVFFLSSMKYNSVSITVALSSVNVFGILTTVFVVGEHFSPVYFVTFLFAFLGIAFCQSFNWMTFKIGWNKGAIFALLATFFWGITYPLFKIYAPSIGAVPLSFLLEAAVTFVAFMWIYMSDSKKIEWRYMLRTSPLKHYVTLATLLIGGTLFSNIAIQNINVLQLNIVNNIQFIVSVILGGLVYKERLSVKQLLGILLIFLSVLITQLFG